MNADLVRILDEHDKANNLLELVILVIQHWIKEMVDKDQFVLNNTLMILETLCKSYQFCARFKNRECMEKLLTISRYPLINTSTKQQVFRIVNCLNSTSSLNALNHYELSRFDNMRGSVGDPMERKLASSLLKHEVNYNSGRFNGGSFGTSMNAQSFGNTYGFGQGLSSTKSVGNLHMNAFYPKPRNFYTPIVKKELAFTDEERIL
mmetsp:Transcript_2973/g.2813  ORF Transcript_2973/g.2813 Transcript_2973/m.2813 type:complete len:206 (+) Transcript_2973:604-1221(+)